MKTLPVTLLLPPDCKTVTVQFDDLPTIKLQLGAIQDCENIAVGYAAPEDTAYCPTCNGAWPCEAHFG